MNAAATGLRGRTAKILVAGGFGVGKTTFVATTSEIKPLHTEAPVTVAGVADNRGAVGKTATTVAMDFGRTTVAHRPGDHLVLHLFGLPGPHRFRFMWPEVAAGSVAALVLADTRRLADALPAIDFLNQHRLPYTVAVNPFPDSQPLTNRELRDALKVPVTVPVLCCDARHRAWVRDVLIDVIEHAARWHRTRAGPTAAADSRLTPHRKEPTPCASPALSPVL